MSRLFVAIDLCEAVRQAARSLQHAARAFLPDEVRFSSIDNLHLTLHFLGEVDPAEVEMVGSILQAESKSLSPFSLTTTTVGMFPPRGRGRVLWLGMQDDPSVLSDYVARLHRALREFTEREESRPFTPHITLARSKEGRIREKEIAALAVQPVAQRVESVMLYSSILGPQGPRYDALMRVPLA